MTWSSAVSRDRERGAQVPRRQGKRRAGGIHDLTGIEAVEFASHIVGERLRHAIEHDLALSHADQPVAIHPGRVERVQIADDRDAEVLVDAQQRIHDDLGVARVERRDGLVRQDQLRLLHQRAGDRDALLLSAGQRVGPLRGQSCHVELVECREGDGAILLAPQLEQRLQGADMAETAHQHVGQHIETAGQVELLEDHRATCPPFAQRTAAQVRHVHVAEPDRALRRIVQPVDHAQQGRLAGAGAADHAHELTGRDLERDIVHGALVAELLHNTVQPQHRDLRGSPALLGNGLGLRLGDDLITAPIQRSGGVRCPTIAGDYLKAEAVSQFGRIVLALPAARRNPRS